jgi:hypothetical protein
MQEAFCRARCESAGNDLLSNLQNRGFLPADTNIVGDHFRPGNPVKEWFMRRAKHPAWLAARRIENNERSGFYGNCNR